MDGSLATLPPELLARVLARLREEEPDAVAVLVTGSYAAGRATPQSDLDLMILTAAAPRRDVYRTWFEPRPPEPPLHVSAGVRPLAEQIELSDEPAEARDWSLGFPTDEATIFLWATDAARAALPDTSGARSGPPTVRRPGGTAEVEDFLESATKVRRAAAAGDLLGARWHARDMAGYAPSLLIPINPERRVRDRRDALAAALDLPVAPPGYREAMLVCLGLAPADDQAVADAALRLACDLLAFLRQRKPDVDPVTGIAPYLADGTLERHLEGA